MDYPLCTRCDLEPGAIADRLRLFELDSADMEAVGREFQDSVIDPNISALTERFYSSLSRFDEFSRIADDPAAAARMKARQKSYLRGLGVNFRTRNYFEERLRIGEVHQQSGVPQSLYQCTFQGLQSLLIEHIPSFVRDDPAAFEATVQFILKITALDMSLAVESYCSARVSDLKQSLASERDRIGRLSKLAETDWLTKLHNRSYSRRRLSAALEKVKYVGGPLCVIMADLDHFKAINDEYGHLVGDDVLQIAAGRMASAARNDDEICRYGGDEFLCILENTGITDGEEVAERMRGRINGDTLQSGGRHFELTLSLGLAEASTDDTPDTLIRRADNALYAAKRAGRDRVLIAPGTGQTHPEIESGKPETR